MASKSGKGWDISNKTWKKWGPLKSQEHLAMSKGYMGKGIANLKFGKQENNSKKIKRGATQVHLAKIHFAQGQKKKNYGKSQSYKKGKPLNYGKTSWEGVNPKSIKF